MRALPRVLILAPHIFPTVTGNAVTVERWRKLLAAQDVPVRLLATQDLHIDRLIACIEDFAPQVIHGHHAVKAGGFFLEPPMIERYATMPLVISLAGTDMTSLDAPQDILRHVLKRACVIITQSASHTSWLEQTAPERTGCSLPVTKSVSPAGRIPCDFRKICGWETADIVFFLPAGIRAVKGNIECLLALEKAFEYRPHLRAVFAGPILDEAYGKQFIEETARLKHFVRWFPLIPPDAMAAAYDSADIILNTSFSEGLSNVLLEAMAAGRPVLASDIAANRFLVLGEKGTVPCGLVFRPGDPEDFKRQALALMDDPARRGTFGRAGQDRIASSHRPEDEARGLIRAYRMALGGKEEEG